MIGRKAIVGPLLLLALLFGVSATPTAMAEEGSLGTEAFTCKRDPAEKSAGWTDEHCKNKVGANAKYIHEAIKTGITTDLEVSNRETESKTVTPFFATKVKGKSLVLEAGGVSRCNTSPTTVENINLGGKKKAEGYFCVRFFGIGVTEPANCSVAGFEAKGIWETKTVKVGAEETMYVNLRQNGATPIGEFTITGGTCSLNGEKVQLTGSIDSPSEKTAVYEGATLKFLAKETINTLKAGAEKAEFSGTFTPRMEPTVGVSEINPITLTTG